MGGKGSGAGESQKVSHGQQTATVRGIESVTTSCSLAVCADAAWALAWLWTPRLSSPLCILSYSGCAPLCYFLYWPLVSLGFSYLGEVLFEGRSLGWGGKCFCSSLHPCFRISVAGV